MKGPEATGMRQSPLFALQRYRGGGLKFRDKSDGNARAMDWMQLPNYRIDEPEERVPPPA